MNQKPPAIHTVSWNGKSIFTARTASGLEAMMQESQNSETQRSYMSPIDLFVSSLGGCTGFTIMNTCKERGIGITTLSSRVESVRSADIPTVFLTVHVHFTLTGDIPEEEIHAIIEETMTLKCPVAVSFGRLTKLTWSHDIISAA